MMDTLVINLMLLGTFLVVFGVPVYAVALLVLFVVLPLVGRLTGRTNPRLTSGRKFAISVGLGLASGLGMYLVEMASSGWNFPVWK